jgi:hypothetical protein
MWTDSFWCLKRVKFHRERINNSKQDSHLLKQRLEKPHLGFSEIYHPGALGQHSSL